MTVTATATMTALASAYDREAITQDIIAVLAYHGLTAADYISVDVNCILQGGQFAGVSLSALVYERPEGLPEPLSPEEERAQTNELMAKYLAVYEAYVAERKRCAA